MLTYDFRKIGILNPSQMHQSDEHVLLPNSDAIPAMANPTS